MSRETELESKLTEGLEIINEWMKLCFEKSTEIQQLKKQLSEKEKEVEELKKEIRDELVDNNMAILELQQSQNQTAIAELKRVKGWLEPKYFDKEQINYLSNAIDQQITELKGGNQ